MVDRNIDRTLSLNCGAAQRSVQSCQDTIVRAAERDKRLTLSKHGLLSKLVLRTRTVAKDSISLMRPKDRKRHRMQWHPSARARGMELSTSSMTKRSISILGSGLMHSVGL